jgi:hypothetical protein
MSILERLSCLVRTPSAASQTPSMECLESRTLLSVAPVLPAVAAGSAGDGAAIVAPIGISQVTTIPLKIQAVVGVAYSGDVGMITGLSPASLARLQATVQWGDNPAIAPQKASLVFDSAGVLHVRGTHTYARDGAFAVTVNVVQNPPAGSLMPTRLYAINSAAIVARNSQGGVTIFPLAKQAFKGVVGTFSDSSALANPLPTSFSAKIRWGDGVASVGQVVRNSDGTYGVVGTHTYNRVGTYRITVIVTERSPIVRVLPTILSTAIVQALTPLGTTPSVGF